MTTYLISVDSLSHVNVLGKTRFNHPVSPSSIGSPRDGSDHHPPLRVPLRVWPAGLGFSLSTACHPQCSPCAHPLGCERGTACGLKDHYAADDESQPLPDRKPGEGDGVMSTEVGRGLWGEVGEEGSWPGPGNVAGTAPDRALGDKKECPGCLSSPCTPVHTQEPPSGLKRWPAWLEVHAGCS